MPARYAHPDSLVSTEFLAAHLDDPTIRVVDGSFKMPGVTPLAREEYASRHIPGAVFFDIDEISDHKSPLPHMLPSEAEFATAMRRLGVGDRHRVVIYDAAGLVSAGRVWWMLRSFGHDNAAILDGGLPKWLAEGGATTDALPAPAQANFTARFNPVLVRDKKQLLANLTSPRDQVLDARASERFAGTAAEPWPGRRSGRIPRSFNLPYNLLTDAKTKTLLPRPTHWQNILPLAGIDMNKPVVTSCGSGVTACVLAFGLYLIGKDDTAVYDGSWAEWGLPGDTPVATGPRG